MSDPLTYYHLQAILGKGSGWSHDLIPSPAHRQSTCPCDRIIKNKVLVTLGWSNLHLSFLIWSKPSLSLYGQNLQLSFLIWSKPPSLFPYMVKTSISLSLYSIMTFFPPFFPSSLAGHGSSSTVRSHWLRDLFETADKDSSGLLSVKEVLVLMNELNLATSKKILSKKFKVSVLIA